MAGFNDLLLKTDDEYQRWKQYLRDNPRRLLMKRERPNLLHPFFNLQLGSHVYNGIGNRALLSAPWEVELAKLQQITCCPSRGYASCRASGSSRCR